MGVSKEHLFTEAQVTLARWAKALGHPARIAIMEVLMQHKGCLCGDIVDVLPLSQSTVSQHLKELKEAGLIKGDADGRTMCYCADDDACCRIAEQFMKFFAEKKCC